MIIKKIGRFLCNVSRPKKCLLDEDSRVDSIVELESPLIFYSRQDGILNIQEKESMNHTFCQFLVSWNGLLLFDATWESKSKFWKNLVP